MAKKKWFDVTVTESYHATYKVLAEDQFAADDLIQDMVNCGDVDPTNDAQDSYDRDVSIDGASSPGENEEYWQRGTGEEGCVNYRWHNKRTKKPTKRAKK